MWAAMSGVDSCVKLLLPVSDALSQDNRGKTALMWAAFYGYTSCVSLLLSVSDVWAKNNKKQSASEVAADRGHTPLAQLIDAYACSQSEKVTLSDSIPALPQQNRSSLRV